MDPLQKFYALPERVRCALVAVLLLALSAVLILQCWSAPFSGYDDPQHIVEHPVVQRDAVTWRELITPIKGESYFPLTLLSYRIDRAIFGSWMPDRLGTWAPGARIMNVLYHACAAFVLWRLMLALRTREGTALFVACAFAAHPMACESVAWLSERKNLLAALFGFLSMLAWVRGEGRIWRVPLTFLLWALALLGKPNALGLLPVFALYDLFGGVSGLHGERPMNWRAPREWIGVGERMLPFAVFALLIIRINVRGFEAVILPPPGGSIFTALLTDLEIIARYLFNTLIPLWISATYLVIPVESAADSRVWIYGAILLAVFAGTVFLSSNRRLAFFSWLWIGAALGTHLNLMSLTYLMQDRYFYLSTPGFLLLLALVIEGLRARLKIPVRGILLAGCGLVLFFTLLAAGRSYVWNSTFTLFSDAVAKQPLAGYGHYGLSQAYRERWFLLNQARSDPLKTQAMRDAWHLHLQASIESPDARRLATYIRILVELGEIAGEKGDWKRAEQYFRRALEKHRDVLPAPSYEADALRRIAMIRLQEGKLPEALQELDRAMSVFPTDGARIDRAALRMESVRRMLAANPGADTGELLRGARADLEEALKNPESEKEARKLLELLRTLEAP